MNAIFLNDNNAIMKNAFSILFSLVLGVCLALYGPFGLAKAGGAVFSMEICANGAATTILVDADGNPVEPSQDCANCLTCCHAAGATSPASCGAAPSFVLLDIETPNPTVQNPILNTRYKFPAPRGPPAVHLAILDLPELKGTVPPFTGQEPRSDGRPPIKDADA